jgi:mannose-1-phosphate guanylyltransferase
VRLDNLQSEEGTRRQTTEVLQQVGFKALIFGAGFGNRLRPLTEVLPKPLMPIFGKPLITFALDHLRWMGIKDISVNTHYLAEKLDDFFRASSDINLVFEPEILETGGALRNIEPWAGDAPLLVYSGDVATDIDLSALINRHLNDGNEITVALRSTSFPPTVAYHAKERRIVDISNQIKPEPDIEWLDFPGISIWNPSVVRTIPVNQKISIPAILIERLKSGKRVGGMVLNDRQWFNVGSRREYLEVHRFIFEQGWRPEYLSNALTDQRIATTAKLGVGVEAQGFSWIGEGCTIEKNVVLKDSILWPGSTVRQGTRLVNSVVTGCEVNGGLFSDADI